MERLNFLAEAQQKSRTHIYYESGFHIFQTHSKVSSLSVRASKHLRSFPDADQNWRFRYTQALLKKMKKPEPPEYGVPTLSAIP